MKLIYCGNQGKHAQYINSKRDYVFLFPFFLYNLPHKGIYIEQKFIYSCIMHNFIYSWIFSLFYSPRLVQFIILLYDFVLSKEIHRRVVVLRICFVFLVVILQILNDYQENSSLNHFCDIKIKISFLFSFLRYLLHITVHFKCKRISLLCLFWYSHWKITYNCFFYTVIG